MGTRASFCVCLLILLSFCELGADNPTAMVWHEEILKRGLDPAKVVDLYAITPEMKDWTQRVTQGPIGSLAKLNRLQDSLFDRNQFPFEYDSNINLTAAEAFSQRRGNCLSFTVLFVALSRSIGIDTHLISARRVASVDKDHSVDLVVVNRHVVAGFKVAATLHIFDFQLNKEALHGYTIIDDFGACSMYHTNIGAQFLRNGDPESAREHLQVAAILNPRHTGAWVNLGVARRRLGDDDGALFAYLKALEADPDSASALTNIAALLNDQGKLEQAREALLRAADRTSSPYTLLTVADLEMARGEMAQARAHIRRARRLGPRIPEVFDSLSRWAYLNGKPEKAASYQRKAAHLRAPSD